MNNFEFSIALLAMLILGVSTAGASGQTSWHVLAGGETTDMKLQGMGYYPGVITINAGDSINWTVGGSEPHTVSFLSGASIPEPGSPETLLPVGSFNYNGTGHFSSGLIIPGMNYTLNFTEPGVYTYQCLLHPGMGGVVIVQPTGSSYPFTQDQYGTRGVEELKADLDAGQNLVDNLSLSSAPGPNGTTIWQAAADIPLPLKTDVVLSQKNNSEANGSIALNLIGPGMLEVQVKLSGLAPNSVHPAHIHAGTCEAGGSVVYPLNNLTADDQGNVTNTTIINGLPWLAIQRRGWFVNVHQGPTMSDGGTTPIACGDVEQNYASYMRYTPDPLTIHADDTVVWTQMNFMMIHTVTFPIAGQPIPDFILPNFSINPGAAAPAGESVYNGTDFFNSGVLSPGQNYTLTFTNPGTYDYLCLIHDEMGMKGKVIVLPPEVSRPSELTLTLNATMDGTGSTVDGITSAVLLNTAGSTVTTATLPDNMTAQFALNGISPGDYFIEVNHLSGDRVPTRIDSNESDINQSVGTRLRNSIIGSISNPTYRIKSRLGGRHQIVNYITGANEKELPYIIVSANPQKIEVREFNTSRELSNFTADGAHPTGDSFQTWILGSNNHGINYNGTDSKCNGCHGNLSTKASTFSAITTNDGWCYRCHYGKSGDGNGFVDPAQPITDIIPPTTTISGVTENGSFNNSVTVTLNATDNAGGAGVNETIYMVNGGPTTTYSAPFVVDTMGSDNVSYWSTDNAGNVESQNMVNFSIVNISEVKATATREIGRKSILPGESTNITVTIAGVTNASALQEIPPEGWNITRGSDNADGFKNNTNEWVWISSEANKTVTYTLTAPVNISIGTYQIEGTIRDVNGTLANVKGDNSIKIDILEVYRRLDDDPAVVETGDLLSAFDDFRNNIAPQGFDRPLNTQEVEELINEWINS